MTCLLGLSPEEAISMLNGREIHMVYGNPPRGAIEGVPRVVRVKETGDAVELTVCVFPELTVASCDRTHRNSQ